MLESSENRKFMLYSKRADQEPKEPKKPKEIGFRFLQLQVGDEVPDFRADSTVGEFGYHDMIDGVWSVLVTFPPDAEAVATTEMGQLSAPSRVRGAQLSPHGRSCASKEQHRAWIEAVEEIEDCSVSFPLISDPEAVIGAKLGLVKQDWETWGPAPVHALVPSTLVILCDIDKRVKATWQHPTTCGRNFYEVLRTLDACQLALFHQVATPANWLQGRDVYVAPRLTKVAANLRVPRRHAGAFSIRYRTTPAGPPVHRARASSTELVARPSSRRRPCPPKTTSSPPP